MREESNDCASPDCSEYLSSSLSNTIQRLESGRNAQANRPTASDDLASAPSVVKPCSDTDIAWPSTGSRYQPVVELQRSSVSELRCSRRLVSCHSSWRYEAPRKAAKKSSVSVPEASGAFAFSGSRSGPRSVLL